ncbi:MAG: capsular polysaccharide export protein [Halocynthiibacter sp.]|jgi:capsular polysaccharide export protein
MSKHSNNSAAGEPSSRRLYVYNGGFLTQGRVRRIMELAGWDIRIGQPKGDDFVGVWGKSPTSGRGEAVAQRNDAPILRVEDAPLRSVLTGRDGEPPVGLCLDQRGVHFDSSTPSDLEHLLATNPLDDTALLDRARNCADWLRASHLSKYNAFDPADVLPDAPYVLVIDQTKGDASIEYGAGSAGLFHEMLVFAQTEHPGAKIVIKTHPETEAGHRTGHFTEADANERVMLLRDPVSPWALMEGAMAVYTVSSQLGFEAIYAGHKPRVFGQPFYSGWGLTADENPVARRERKLTRAQLFAGAMLLYPTWYDPYRDQLCELEDVIAGLEARARAWREDRHGYVTSGMRLWKRGHLRKFFGPGLRFVDDPQKGAAMADGGGQRLMAWGMGGPDDRQDRLRVEDGFLRSRGLGASLVPPLSLIADDLGMYYDPRSPSRLEAMISARVELPNFARFRIDALIRRLNRARISKYNLEGAALPELPAGHRILVAGQVEDDASILAGCGEICTNAALLAAARAANPEAVIIYKPHPDVEAGLRAGAYDASDLADVVLHAADPIALIEAVDEVWVMTSLLGFEALLRGKPVTCAGLPFYAGWGLTRDLIEAPERRAARPDLAGLAYAALIDYPRYFDPQTGLACSAEVIVDRLETGEVIRGGLGLRLLAKAQGALASYAYLWRRGG